MQRRITQRSSANNSTLPRTLRSSNGGNAKIKQKKNVIEKLLYFTVIAVFVIVCMSTFLTPSQKNELVEAEHRVEDWLQNGNSHPSRAQEPKIAKGKDPPRKLEEPKTAQRNDNPLRLEEPKTVKRNDIDKQSDTKEEIKEPRHEKAAESDQTPIHAPSRHWVLEEKVLKKKLKVLHEQQKKGKNLGVPVLTRYLGENIPAFVGTPESTMEEEEWKKLVEEAYKEMRKEEEEWQKKMALLIEKQERDMGITTP